MNSKKYDLIVVGSGIYGATIAQQALEHGLRCLVVERREQVGGNVRDEWHERICVHQYGAHIFHTNHKNVWEYVNRFATFIPYYHKVMARSGNKMYHLPFSLQTFYEIFGISNPSQIDEVLQDEHKREFYIKPANFEEQAINLIGRTLYDLFVKGYTEKQWGCDPRKLSNNLIQRIPIHLNWNCDYFDDYYQGLPEKGYSEIIKGMLKGIEVKTGVDFIKDIDYWIENSNMIVYTGMVDELLHYDLGVLGYRSLKFETQLIQNVSDYQGIAVVNELNKEIPYTRTVEHRHITPDFVPYHKSPTIITREFPLSWSIGQEAYYPICDTQNKQLYLSYREFLRHKYPSIHLGGRLGNFQYYDMDDAIQDALTSFPTISASLRLV